MADPAAMEMPALRLRERDVLPAYGESATVVRPPVISVDGAMINVLIAASPDATPRLARLPVGLRVSIIRPQADTETAFVRSSKVARSSGARIAVLDLTHPDAEIPAQIGEAFATLCTTHHSVKTHAGISTAQAQASHPEQWCEPCAEATRQRAHDRVYGTTTETGAAEATA